MVMLGALPSSHHETEHASVHPDFRFEGMLEERATLCRHCAARLAISRATGCSAIQLQKQRAQLWPRALLLGARNQTANLVLTYCFSFCCANFCGDVHEDLLALLCAILYARRAPHALADQQVRGE